MRWTLGAIAVLALVGGAAYALLVPPTGGPGWALVEDDANHRPLLAERSVVLYATHDGRPLLVVTVFDSSRCPPKVRGVELGSGRIDITIARGLLPLTCTGDAVQYEFGIGLDRDQLELPHTIVVHHGEGEPWTTVLGEGPG